uniref:Uncharacterized protein n=1 Tax=Timema douglasi TaxID=61478 RepID=A0A7R8ZBV5_TIMDO|nr:unnamed protein product [Timema douglasi]
MAQLTLLTADTITPLLHPSHTQTKLSQDAIRKVTFTKKRIEERVSRALTTIGFFSCLLESSSNFAGSNLFRSDTYPPSSPPSVNHSLRARGHAAGTVSGQEMETQLSLSIILSAMAVTVFFYWYLTSTFSYRENRSVPFIKPLSVFGNVVDYIFLRNTLAES